MNQRYVPDPRKCDDKSWLYEQYWGQLKSARKISEMDEVEVNCRKLKAAMKEFGIPIRGQRYSRDNSVSPYSCFYGDDESTTDTTTERRYDPDYETEEVEWTAAFNGKTY